MLLCWCLKFVVDSQYNYLQCIHNYLNCALLQLLHCTITTRVMLVGWSLFIPSWWLLFPSIVVPGLFSWIFCSRGFLPHSSSNKWCSTMWYGACTLVSIPNLSLFNRFTCAYSSSCGIGAFKFCHIILHIFDLYLHILHCMLEGGDVHFLEV